jgi:UDP-N-acetylglucosamine 1-carboxyvinyltransferase
MTAKYRIRNCPAKLIGEVAISGSKNAALPLLAATILTDEPCILKNVPRVRDVFTMIDVLKHLGVECEWLDDHTLKTMVKDEGKWEVSHELMKTMRASICVLGPLLGKRKKAKVSIPGGCVIGVRPVDLHISAIEKLGAKVNFDKGYLIASADSLNGAIIDMQGQYGTSVTGTENAILASCLAEGETSILNAAREPEVTELIRFLIKMGAQIDGAGTTTIKIKGVKKLYGCEHVICPDRIETGTFVVLGLITQSDIIIKNVNEKNIENILTPLIEAGATMKIGEDYLHIQGPQELKPLNITTAPYPGFPTDMNPIFCVLMTQINGESILIDTVFPDRFIYTAELIRMGAKIKKEGNKIRVFGKTALHSANVMCSDIRSGAALVLASACATGDNIVDRIYHIERGYENFHIKLKNLGLSIERINE